MPARKYSDQDAKGVVHCAVEETPAVRSCLFVLAAVVPWTWAHAEDAPRYQLAGARPGVVVMADLAHPHARETWPMRLS